MEEGKKISSSALLGLMGVTPADNKEGLKTALPWKSSLGGIQTKALFQYQKTLKSITENHTIFGPFSVLAAVQNVYLQTFLLDPIKAHARISVRSGREPDLFRDMNGWIYKNYARLLYDLCGYFMKDHHFDIEKARRVSTTKEGKKTLKKFIYLLCEERPMERTR